MGPPGDSIVARVHRWELQNALGGAKYPPPPGAPGGRLPIPYKPPPAPAPGPKGVGQPGTWESFIPVWGSGRAAIDDFQNGNWGWGLFNGAMAIGDVFLVKSIATAIGKAAFRGAMWLAKMGLRGALRDAWCWLAKTGCFAAGTPLLTPTGDKLIEDFKPGDWILTAPEDDPEAPLEAKQVEEVFRDVSRLLNLRVEGRTIQTTPEHPFYARGRGWIVAQELQPGDLLRSHDCKWVPVEAVEPGAEEAPVYNLRVADYHTYFAGSREWGFSVWAHNVCSRMMLQRLAEEQYAKLAGKIHNHHIIPKYLGGPANGATVPLDAAYHQLITNAFRNEWPYGASRIPSPQELAGIMRRVYSMFPLA